MDQAPEFGLPLLTRGRCRTVGRQRSRGTGVIGIRQRAYLELHRRVGQVRSAKQAAVRPPGRKRRVGQLISRSRRPSDRPETAPSRRTANQPQQAALRPPELHKSRRESSSAQEAASDRPELPRRVGQLISRRQAASDARTAPSRGQLITSIGQLRSGQPESRQESPPCPGPLAAGPDCGVGIRWGQVEQPRATAWRARTGCGALRQRRRMFFFFFLSFKDPAAAAESCRDPMGVPYRAAA